MRELDDKLLSPLSSAVTTEALSSSGPNLDRSMSANTAAAAAASVVEEGLGVVAAAIFVYLCIVLFCTAFVQNEFVSKRVCNISFRRRKI